MTTTRICGLLCIASMAVCIAQFGWGPRASISGKVMTEDGPVSGAHVRRQGSDQFAVTDSSGRFSLRERHDGRPLTAWKNGFRIASLNTEGKRPLLMLMRLPAEDNPAYVWQRPDPDASTPNACGNCHGTIHEEWAGSAHARSATNPRVLGLTTGVDAKGKRHLRWNVSEEHPLGVGVCSRCHAPTHRSSELDYDLTKVKGVALRGVHCDLCHKITDVPADKLGNRFGIDGLQLLRPHGDEQIFYGPLEDAVRPGESFGKFAIYKESRFCASCHEGTLFGVKVYTTYSEWLDSPAAKREVQCQQCHMAPTGALTNIAPGKGGVERNPMSLSSHATPGASRAMLEKSVKTDFEVKRLPDRVRVSVRIRAENVGHRVPTGYIDRHLLLLVEATDGAGAVVESLLGPKLTPGLGDPWAGRPGALFGRWLLDDQGNGPLPFWTAPEGERDTRLWPEKTEERVFEFSDTAAIIRVRLLYRKFWPEVLQSRGWDDQQMTIFDRTERFGK